MKLLFNMKLVLGIWLSLLSKLSSAQDLSSYSSINSIIEGENLKITPIRQYFYITNSKNEKQIIAEGYRCLYKFDQSGSLIDTLPLPNNGIIMLNIQSDNYFVYFEDGYLPNWIKTGDKTKQPYDKVYNKDLTMDVEAIKQYSKEIRDFENANSAQRNNEYYDYLEKKAENIELIKLLKSLNQQAESGQRGYFSTFYKNYIFILNHEVVMVKIPNELEYHINKLKNNNKIEVAIPVFSDEQKPFLFKKSNWVKVNRNILSTTSGGYWLGTAYYNLNVCNKVLKIKQESVQNKKPNLIQIDRNIFPDNKHFILVADKSGMYFVKENEAKN